MCGNIWCKHSSEQNDFFIEECHPTGRCVILLIAKDDSVFWLVDYKEGVFPSPSVCKVTKTIHLYLKAVQIGQHFSPEFFVSRASFL